MSYWWLRALAKWHRVWFRFTDIEPVDDERTIWSCTCGGFAQILRDESGAATIEFATCGYWVTVMRAGQRKMPAARVLR